MRTGWRSESEVDQIPLAAQTDQIRSLFLMQDEDSNSLRSTQPPPRDCLTYPKGPDRPHTAAGWMDELQPAPRTKAPGSSRTRAGTGTSAPLLATN